MFFNKRTLLAIFCLLALHNSYASIGVIFDCDGVLVDSEAHHFAAWQKALEPHDIALSLEEYLPFVGSSSAHIVQTMASRYKKNLCDQVRLTKEHFYAARKEKTAAIKAAVAFVNHLAQNKANSDLVLGLASSAPRAEIMANLAAIGLTDAFDVIISGTDDLAEYNDPNGTNKPKPYIYQKAAKLLGVAPARCIVFEDSNPGVRAAHGAGMTVIAIPNEYTRQQDFSQANFIVKSFDALDPKQLGSLLRAA